MHSNPPRPTHGLYYVYIIHINPTPPTSAAASAALDDLAAPDCICAKRSFSSASSLSLAWVGLVCEIGGGGVD